MFGTPLIIPLEIAFIFEESGTVHTQCTPEQVSRRSIDGLFEVEYWRRDKETRQGEEGEIDRYSGIE